MQQSQNTSSFLVHKVFGFLLFPELIAFNIFIDCFPTLDTLEQFLFPYVRHGNEAMPSSSSILQNGDTAYSSSLLAIKSSPVSVFVP